MDASQKYMSKYNKNTMSRSRLSHNLLIAFRTISTRRRLEADCSDGLQVQLQRKLTAPYFRLEALRFLDVKTPVHDQFAKVGVKKCLDDVEMSLKQKEFIPAGNFKIFCGMFYRLSSLNKLCQNQVVETCGLERIVNLLKMIVERQEQYKDSKCHGLGVTNRRNPRMDADGGYGLTGGCGYCRRINIRCFLRIFMSNWRMRNPPFPCLKGGNVLQIADILSEIFGGYTSKRRIWEKRADTYPPSTDNLISGNVRRICGYGFSTIGNSMNAITLHENLS
uniref:Uncharacterized protein n=1 Tax=Romanomermis culicivorax TaxID=13658 RepID=A0A915KK28_ROMCU